MDQVNICIYDYRVFCMFGNECDKKIFQETCIGQECVRSACPKPHPRFCNSRFTFFNCRFENNFRYLHNTPGYAQRPPNFVEKRGYLDDVKSLKNKIESLIEEIKLLREENTTKAILIQAADKNSKGLERELEGKDRSVQQFSEKNC